MKKEYQILSLLYTHNKLDQEKLRYRHSNYSKNSLISLRVFAVPVGLFGEAIKTTFVSSSIKSDINSKS